MCLHSRPSDIAYALASERDCFATLGESSVQVMSVRSDILIDPESQQSYLQTALTLRLPVNPSDNQDATATYSKTVSLESYADGSKVSFDFTFWPNPSAAPAIQKLAPSTLPIEKVVALQIVVSDIGAIDSKDEVVVTIGGEECVVQRVAVFRQRAVLSVDTPLLTVDGQHDLLIYKRGDKEGGVQHSVVFYNPNKPEVRGGTSSPPSASELGGSVISVSIFNFPRNLRSASQLTVSFNGTAAKSTLIKSKYGATKLDLSVTTPRFPSGGDVICTITAGTTSVSFNFHFVSLPYSDATVAYFDPTTVKVGDGDMVTMRLGDFYTDVKSGASENYGLAIEIGEGDDRISVDAVKVSQIGKYFSVRFRVPASVGAGEKQITVSPNDRPLNKGVATLTIEAKLPVIHTVYPKSAQPNDSMQLQVANLPAAVLKSAITLTATIENEGTSLIAVSGMKFVSKANIKYHIISFECPEMGKEKADVVLELSVADATGEMKANDGFSFSPADAPAIVAMSPSSGDQYGGDDISFVIANLGPVDASDARVFFGSKQVPPALITAKSAGLTSTLLAISGSPSQPKAGKVPGTIALTSGSNLTFSFRYEQPPQPEVSDPSPATGPSSGGLAVYLSVIGIADWSNVAGVSLVCRFAGEFVEVQSAKYKKSVLKIKVTSPAVTKAGTYDIELYRSDRSTLKAIASFDYFDVSKPRLREDTSTPKPSSGSTNGGTKIYLEFEGFDLVKDKAELQISCAGELGSIERVYKSTDELLSLQASTPAVASAVPTTCTVYPSSGTLSDGAEFTFSYTKPAAMRVETSQNSVACSSGDLLKVVVKNFPVPVGRKTSVDDIVIYFSDPDADNAIIAYPSRIIYSHAEKTAFLVTASPCSAPEPTTITVRAASDATASDTFVLTYTADPLPEILGVKPSEGPASGGTTVQISLANVDKVTDDTLANVVVSFGLNNPGKITRFYSNPSFTKLWVTAPAGVSSGIAKLLVQMDKTDPAAGEAAAEFEYINTDLRLGYVYPKKAKSDGGRSFNLLLTNGPKNTDKTFSTADVEVGIGGVKAALTTVSFKSRNGRLTVSGTIPDVSGVVVFKDGEKSQQVTATATVTGYPPVAFEMTLLKPDGPMIKKIRPPAAAVIGGTKTTLTIENFGTIAQPSDLLISFGNKAATTTAIKVLKNGAVQVTVLTPSFGGPENVDLAVSSSSDSSISATVPFEMFAICDFKSYCSEPGRDMIVAASRLSKRPPSSALCQSSYCEVPLPDPFLRRYQPRRKSGFKSSGGESVTATIAYFPVVQSSSDVQVYFGDTPGTVTKVLASNKRKTNLLLQTPDLKTLSGEADAAGKVLIKVSVVTGVVAVEFDMSFYQVAIGNPVFFGIFPASSVTDSKDRMSIEMSNMPPLAKDEVSVEFTVAGKVASGTVKRVKRGTGLSSSVLVVAPDMSTMCMADCTTSVRVLLTGLDGNRAANFNYNFTAPKMQIVSVNPKSAPQEAALMPSLQLAILNLGQNPKIRLHNIDINIDKSATKGKITYISFVVPTSSTFGEVALTVNAGGQEVSEPFEYQEMGKAVLKYFNPRSAQVTGGTKAEMVIEFPSAVQQKEDISLSMTVCDTTITLGAKTNSIALSWLADTSAGFDLVLPSCSSPGKNEASFVVSGGAGVTKSGGDALAASVEFVVPDVTVSPIRGSTLGGFSVSLLTWGAVQNIEDVTVNLGGKSATIQSVAAVAGGFTRISILTPSSDTIGGTSGTINVASTAKAFPYTYTYLASPELTLVSPAAGSVSGKDTVTLSLTNLPRFDPVSDLTKIVVMFGDTSDVSVQRRLPVRSASYSPGQQTVSFQTPAVLAAGIVAVSVSHSDYDGAVEAAANTFQYEPLEAVIMTYAPESCALAGDVDIVVEIANMGEITDAAEMTVEFGFPDSAGGKQFAQVTELIYSDFVSTRLIFRAPASTAPGIIQVEAKTRYNSAVFYFSFVDASLSVSTAKHLHGPSLGSTIVSARVSNFPLVTRDDLDCAFGEAIGNVENVSSFVDVNGTRVTDIMMTSPPSADQLVFTAGLATVDVIVSLAAESSKRVSFPFIYQQPLQASGAMFAHSYKDIVVTFNQPVSVVETVGLGTELDCAEYVAESVLALLGENGAGACVWSSPENLVVQLNSGFRIEPMQTFSLVGGILSPALVSITSAQDSTLVMAATDLILADDPDAKAPTAVIDGATEVGMCDTLKLDGSASIGTRLTYSWTSPSDPNLAGLLEAEPGAKLELPASKLASLPTNEFFEVVLVTTDFAGRSSSGETKTIFRSSLPVPFISIDGASALTVDAVEELVVNALAEFSACAEASQLVFEWSQVLECADCGITTHVPTFEAKGRGLQIPAKSLLPGRRYMFQVVGYAAADSASRGTATVTINTKLPDLFISIEDGDREASNSAELLLDGSNSADPADLENVSAVWSCTDTATATACRSADRSTLQMNASLSASVGAQALPAGEYKFELEISTESRVASTSQTVNVVEKVIPVLSLGVSEPDQLKITGILNPVDRLVATASAVSGSQNNDGAPLGFNWAIKTDTGADIVGLDLSNANVAPLGVKGETFLLEGGWLLAGQSYSVVATVTETQCIEAACEEVSTSSSIPIKVNAPPGGGKCTTEPASGISFDTLFTVSCIDYKDDVDSELDYEFFVVNGNGADVPYSETILRAKGKSSGFEDFPLDKGLLEVGDERRLTVVAYISDSSGARVKQEMVVSVIDKFDTLTAEQKVEEANQIADTTVTEAKMKGDAIGTTNLVTGLASVTSGSATVRRLTDGESRSLEAVSLNQRLVADVQFVMDSSLLSWSAGTAPASITALAAITAAASRGQLEAQTIQDSANLMVRLVSTLSGESITPADATPFLDTLSQLMSSGAVTKIRQSLSSEALAKHTTLMSNADQQTQLLVGHALLKSKLTGEPTLHASASVAEAISLALSKQIPVAGQSMVLNNHIVPPLGALAKEALQAQVDERGLKMRLFPTSGSAEPLNLISSISPSPYPDDANFSSAMSALILSPSGSEFAFHSIKLSEPIVAAAHQMLNTTLQISGKSSPNCARWDAISGSFVAGASAGLVTYGTYATAGSSFHNSIRCGSSILDPRPIVAIDTLPSLCANYAACSSVGSAFFCGSGLKPCDSASTPNPTGFPTQAPTPAPTIVPSASPTGFPTRSTEDLLAESAEGVQYQLDFEMQFLGYTVSSFTGDEQQAVADAIRAELSLADSDSVELTNIKATETETPQGSYQQGSYQSGRMLVASEGLTFVVKVITSAKDSVKILSAVSAIQRDPSALEDTFKDILQKNYKITPPADFGAAILKVSQFAKVPTSSPTKAPTKVPTKEPDFIPLPKISTSMDPNNPDTAPVLVVLYFFGLFSLCCLCGVCCGWRQLVQWNAERHNRKAGKLLRKSRVAPHAVQIQDLEPVLAGPPMGVIDAPAPAPAPPAPAPPAPASPAPAPPATRIPPNGPMSPSQLGAPYPTDSMSTNVSPGVLLPPTASRITVQEAPVMQI